MNEKYIKARVPSPEAEVRIAQVLSDLLQGDASVIAALTQAPWFRAIREVSRRYECATHNQDGTPWVYIPTGTHDFNAVLTAQRLFPDILEIQDASEAEMEEVFQQWHTTLPGYSLKAQV